jgi:hypothetical protein
LEDLVNRGLVALKKYIKRPEWVAALVHENIFQKILASFAEGLKRKALSIEHGKSSSSSTNDINNSPGKGMEIAGSTPSMRNRNRKKSTATAPGGGGRASFHQNTLILQSLEEEFRVMDFGWERNDFSDLRNKPSAWIDFLRGCVRFRCYSGVLILKQVTKIFPLEQSNTLYGGNFLPNMIGTSTGSVVAINTNNSNNTSTTGTTGGGGASFLNRLFASDPTPDPMAPSAEPTRRAGSITTMTTVTTSAKQDDEEEDMMMMSKNNTTNKKTDAVTSSGEKSIYDGILSGFKENPKIYNDLSTTAGSFVFQNLKEVVSLELESMKKLIAYRIYSLKTILLSAYAFIVHMELQQQQQQQPQNNANYDSKMMETMNNPNFPSHLSKIILALSEEKKCLAAYFHQMSLEYGGNKYDYYLSSIQHHNNHHHGHHGHGHHHHDPHGLQPSPPQTQPSSSKKSGSSHKTNATSTTAGKTNTSSYNGDSGVTPFYWESDGESEGGMGADGASDREGGGGGGRRSKAYSSSFGTESELFFHASSSPSRPAVGRKPSFLSSKPGQIGQQSSSTGRSYATYLFEELCKGTLECYEEILKKLMTGQLFDVNPMKLSSTTTSTTTTTGAAAGKVPFRALRQCYEEMEFFKVSLLFGFSFKTLFRLISSSCIRVYSVPFSPILKFCRRIISPTVK